MAWILQDIRVGTSQIGRVDEDATVKLGTEVPAYSPVLDQYDDFIYLQGVAGTTVGARVVYDDLSFATILSTAGAGGLVATAMAAVGEGQYGWYRKRFVEPRVQSFYDRDAIVQAFTDGQEFDTGTVLMARGIQWEVDNTSTEILDMPGTKPLGTYTPQHFGSPAEIKERVSERAYGYTLADRFSTLAAAQAIYPKATALTETLDRHSAQRMIDALRAYAVPEGTGPLLPWRQDAKRIAFHFPGGEYVIDKSLDFTGIRGSVGMWDLTGDRAVIYHQAVGETCFDLLNSTRCRMRGFIILGEVIRGSGCPRSAILIGRGSAGTSSGEHSIRDIEFAGAFTLGYIHDYASEVVDIDDIIGTNHLDPRQTILDLNSLSGDPAAGETVSWTSGTGTIVSEDGTYAIIQVDSGSAAITNGIAMTASGGATWTAGSPYAMPDGEWTGARSFCVVIDPDNKFGTGSVHTTNASVDDAASHIDTAIGGQIVHSGRGDPFYIGCGARQVRVTAYIASTGDDDGAAGFTVNSNQSNALIDFHATVLTESDGGDTSADTGIDYGIRFTTDSATTLSCFECSLHQTIANPAIGNFHAESGLTTVNQYGWNISIGNVGSGPSSRRMWAASSVSKFRFNGFLSFTDDANPDYLNIADLSAYSTGYARVPDVADANLLRVTNSGFPVFDETAYAFINSVRVQANSGTANFIARTDSTEIGRLQFTTGEAQLDPDGDGSKYLWSDAAFYWGGTTGTVDLGILAKRWDTIYGTNLNLAPSASLTPANNGDLVVEATNNTTLTFKFKGSDGTVRSGTITLS